jgi:hypothetical protein
MQALFNQPRLAQAVDQIGAVAALDQPAPVISAIEPSPIDASTPSTIQSADAIVVEIIQSVTVAAPGQKSEDNEEVEHTGSTSPEHAAFNGLDGRSVPLNSRRLAPEFRYDAK